ncbi:LCP family protein [Kineosporia rhizophila]|uniref:LCP family protein n=1 Tax=Kineosporia rhizophila TaxID=84633 RepID=UPI001E53D074|nr:LCP family protein [Kineosporia rhizophila]MCE0536813.1 LCP family protein [Kineosporia rhizophila]
MSNDDPRRGRGGNNNEDDAVQFWSPEEAAGRPARSGRPQSSQSSQSSQSAWPEEEDQVGDMYRQHGGADPNAQYGQHVDERDEPYGVSGYGQYGAGSGGRGTDGRPSGRGPAGPGGPGRPGPGGPGGPGRPPSVRPSGRQLPRPRVKLVVLVLVGLLIAYPIILGFTAWSSLNRVDAVGPAHEGSKLEETSGRTYLVVGSDSRENLSDEEKKDLGTGSAAGQRTDTIMLLHVPDGDGPTVLISVPRDSYVPIPGHDSNKINAAYAIGGPTLLIKTLEEVGGVKVDDYVETGLGGFADIVNAIGGVELCPKRAMKDAKAHINLKKGCQDMDGKTALGYARARYSDPRGDLGRVERQRETLAAIAKKTLSPGTLIQPWRAIPAAKAGGGALTVDESTGPIALTKFVLAMRAVSGSDGLSMTVPIGNPDFRVGGMSAVKWDTEKALQMFEALKNDDTEVLRAMAEEQKKQAK